MKIIIRQKIKKKKWEKSQKKENETTYHFRCLKSCIVLHMKDASYDGIQSIVRK